MSMRASDNLHNRTFKSHSLSLNYYMKDTDINSFHTVHEAILLFNILDIL